MFCIRFLHLYNSAYFASAQRTRIENNRNKNGKNDNNLYNVIQIFLVFFELQTTISIIELFINNSILDMCHICLSKTSDQPYSLFVIAEGCVINSLFRIV